MMEEKDLLKVPRMMQYMLVQQPLISLHPSLNNLLQGEGIIEVLSIDLIKALYKVRTLKYLF